MEHKVTRLTHGAQLISKFTNPSILSPITLLLIAFTGSTNATEMVSWVAVIIIFFVLIPAVYVYLRISSSENRGKSVIELTTFLKLHPRDILTLAFLLGLPCLAFLSFLKAPTTLIFAIVALLAGSIVTAVFNIFYRVSFHLTGITILILMAAQVWGPVFLVLLVTIPLIAWAKFQIHDHTIPQLVIGVVVGVVVSLATLYLFGLRVIG